MKKFGKILSITAIAMMMATTPAHARGQIVIRNGHCCYYRSHHYASGPAIQIGGFEDVARIALVTLGAVFLISAVAR